jgi:hypothetical protein
VTTAEKWMTTAEKCTATAEKWMTTAEKWMATAEKWMATAEKRMTTAGAPVPQATARHLITGAEKGLPKTTFGWRTTGKNFPPFFLAASISSCQASGFFYVNDMVYYLTGKISC